MSEREGVGARGLNSRRSLVLAGVVALAVLGSSAGCADGFARPTDGAADRGQVAPTAGVSGAASTRQQKPVRPNATVGAAVTPDPLVALATADAAWRTGTGSENVRIVRVEPREWPDRSLGCPRPGLGYAQAITPGYLIVAEAGDRRFEYHTDQAEVVLCAS